MFASIHSPVIIRSMQIFFPRETEPGEPRCSIVPDNAAKLVKLGAEVVVESGIGESIGVADQKYEQAGARVSSERAAALGAADMVMRLRKPPVEEVPQLKPDALHISYLDPFNERELVEQLAQAGISAFSMEMIPRSTIAQKMDALSSQANLAGYFAMILAAERLDRVIPMMMTPSGTLSPARVFVIGAGVAGLQAIATARRLGARVEAFDTRPVVEEQVASLGAKFIKVDLGDTGQTSQGYARELSAEQLDKQREAMARHCASADIVITTAQVFGRKAPRIVTAEMLEGMQPGAVVVDMAVESGGNVEGSQLGEEVVTNGVRIIGLANLPGHVAADASRMYSSNLYNFLEHFWDKESASFQLDEEDEIIKGCLLTRAGGVVNEALREFYAKQG